MSNEAHQHLQADQTKVELLEFMWRLMEVKYCNAQEIELAVKEVTTAADFKPTFKFEMKGQAKHTM